MRLGKYQLLRKLATGGMAEVFLAKTDGPMGFEKLLVIKRILPHLAEDPQFVEMFLGEAKLAAQLNHPNLVQIFDFGRAEGSYFIAMEYIDGENLRLLLARGRDMQRTVPFPIAARIVSFAAEGLAYAHNFTDLGTGQPLHLIHRDVSPDNILVSRSGAVKLVDFGIAKATGQSHQTQAGTVKGKVAYMAPEQLRGEPLDRRVDLYALGIVLYELCTGRMPFEADSDASMVRAVLYDRPVAAVERVPSMPRGLQDVLTRLTARRREDRYADCHTLHLDLERFLRQTSRDSTTAFVLSRWVSQLAPTGPPTAPPSPSSIRPAEPAAFTASAFAPTGPILLDQPVPEAGAPPVPMELDRTVRRPTRDQPASQGFVFPTALEQERSAVEPVPMRFKRTNSRQDAIRTDVRPTSRRSGGGGLLFRIFLLALLGVAGAGLGLWAAGRTDLLAVLGLPIPGATPSPAVAAPTTGTSDTSRSPAVPPAPAAAPTALPTAPVAASPTPAAPPAVASTTPPSAPGTANDTPPPPAASATPPAPGPKAPASSTPPPATSRPAPPAVAAAVPPAARTAASKPPAPAESDDAAASRERRSSDREKLLGAFADAKVAAEAPATVRVESTPKLRVRLGDKVLGTTPLTVSLPPPGGSAEIELFDPGLNISKTVSLELTQGDNGIQKIVIPRGTLELKVNEGVSVTIDGKAAGTAPLDPVQLYEGRHQIQLSKGDLQERRLVEISGGQTEVLEFSFPEDR
jgi:serine/threonine-protein kinase